MRKWINQIKKTAFKLKPKHKLTAKGWVALLLVVGLAAIAIFAYISRPTAIDRLSLTYLDNLNSGSLAYELQDSFQDSYAVKDYTIYGESLVLYQDDYDKKGFDGLYGKNVSLRNLETGQELNFTFSGGADGGIDLGSLQPGVYEVFVYDDYKKKRVYFEEPFESDVFTTMRRGRSVNDINLNASKDYLKKFGIEMDKNYLFLTVTDSLPKVKVVDVILDPSGMVSYMNANGYDEGYKSEIIDEAKASYTLALHVQDYLKEAGLRVEISRPDDQDASYYGVGSRVGIGYQKQAKVFMSLTMTETETAHPFILASPFTNGSLANQIAYEMKQNGITLSTVSKLSQLNQGVGLDQLIVDDQYEYTNWSMYPQLRETGGKVTFTGTGEQWAANSNFSNSYGMYGLLFSYASTEVPESQSYFLENQEAIARSLAEGILKYFHIPAQEEKK